MEIRKGRLWIVIGAMLLCTGSILSQQPSANTPPKEPDRLPVGVWESVQADGSAIGIDLSEVLATVQSGQLEPEDFTRRKSVLQVGVFQKHHQRIACGEENFFVIGEKDDLNHDAVSSYTRGKLEIHYHDHVTGSEIQLILILDSFHDVWTGHFQREFFDRPFQGQRFDGQVVLHRTSLQPDPAQGGCFTGGSKS
jgi:hypothetical protein